MVSFGFVLAPYSKGWHTEKTIKFCAKNEIGTYRHMFLKTHQTRLKTVVATATFTALMAFSVPAHAGFFSWLDEATTYNEDQKRPLKPQILPKGPPAPLLYDTTDGERWSRYYTRDDLVPVNYLNGSATKVMRPHQSQPQTRDDMLHGYVLDRNGNPIMGPDGQPITGYDVMQRRAALNKAQQMRGQLFIGEPDDVNLPRGGDRTLGVKTRIGSPDESWRNSVPNHFNPQPGDYDYVPDNRTGRRYNEYAAPPGGDMIAGTRRDGFGNVQPYDNNRRYNQGGQGYGQGGTEMFPDNYTVQRGDTLSEISEQDKIYGDWKLWPLIYDANRSQISDPDLIYPEQRLGIPRDYTFDEADNARNRAYPPYGRR